MHSLQGCALKKVLKPASKKKIISQLVVLHQLSERRSCKMITLSRTGYRHQTKTNDDERVKARLLQLAQEYPRYGYRILHALLKREGLVINRKRTYRLYSELSLQVRTKRRKKLYRCRTVLAPATSANQRWSMDFVSDQLTCGRRIRILNIVDDYSKELVGQLSAFGISGLMVSNFLTSLLKDKDKRPQQIICDNGPEFTCKAMFFWSKAQDIKLAFIQPGKPTQNAFVESFNGKFRNECLNQHWFRNLEEVIKITDKYRHHYNHHRPHSSLGYRSPVEFLKGIA